MAWPMPRLMPREESLGRGGVTYGTVKYRLGPVLVFSPPGCAISRHSFSSVRTPDSLSSSSLFFFSFFLSFIYYLLPLSSLCLLSWFYSFVISGLIVESSRLNTKHTHTHTHRHTHKQITRLPLFPLLALICDLPLFPPTVYSPFPPSSPCLG